jgi:hypothetical protein
VPPPQNLDTALAFDDASEPLAGISVPGHGCCVPRYT